MFKLETSSAAALAAGLIAVPASAQEIRGQEIQQASPQLQSPAVAAAVGPATGGLEEIVVTARRISENLQDVPVAITIYSGETLQRQNALRLSDIARTTPGLNIREANSNPAASTIALRGQVQTDVLATLDPSVGTYVDGLYWARAYGFNSNLLDLQSVQVLKGPQGTLFGRNTTGGAILVQTNDPDFSGISGLVSGTYGRFDERSATGIVNLPIVNDRIAVRAAVQRYLRDGITTDVGPVLPGRKYNNRDSWSARGKVLIQATDNLSILGSAEYFKSDLNGPTRRLSYFVPSGLTPPVASAEVAASAAARGFPASYPAISASAAAFAGNANLRGFINSIAGNPDAAGQFLDSVTPDPTAAVKTYTYSGTATLDTFFGAIKFIGGYRRIRSFSANDLEGSPFAVHQSTGVQRLSQASGELQITGKAFSDLIDFAAGAFYFHEKGVDASVRGTSIPTLNAITNEFSGSIDNDSSGLYGQANWHISDRLTFTGGLRYSVDDKGLTTRNTSFNRTTGILTCSVPTASVAAGCALTRNDDFAGVSYLAGLDYKIADDVLVYAKTSKGFRSGGQNLRANTVASALPFRPEIAYAYEGGIKSEFFDRRVRLNLAGYYSEINDIQRSTLVGFANGTTSTILSNAGKLRVYGLESDLAVRLFEGFEFGATGAVTNPKYLRYAEVPSRTNLTGDRRSERIENIPKYQFSLSANYDRDLGFARIALNADYSWTSAYALQSYVAFLGDPQGVTIDPFNGKTVSRNIIDATTSPKQGVLSARAALTFMDRQLEIAIYGRNLTNNRKRVSALYVAGINYVSETLREPRAYGMTATYRFGH